jgi:hypothetical protein
MHHSQTQLLSALQFLMTSDMPSEHKAVLIETVTHVLREHDTAEIRSNQAAAQATTEWQAHETTQLRAQLDGRIANSWQQADETALRLASQLRRHPLDIRAKAVELGFGVAVDFRLAKERMRAERE